ncbi:MAG: chemotaxis protein [Actinobacteria bacterium]|nr:MAG: chemotaxis protein [Actinomycetota bacterium]
MTTSFLTGMSWGDPDADVVRVGVGEFAIAEHPAVLMTPALGSCVGVAVWDAYTRRGGLAHIMLPTPSESSIDGKRERFATIGIPQMIAVLTEEKPTRRLVAKLMGGAAMFKTDSGLASVGDRNLHEVRRQLGLLNVPILAEDTGGSHARTVELHLDTGVVVVRSYMYGIKEL